MRIFFSIGLDNQAQKVAEDTQNQFKSVFKRSKVTWVDAELFHLTVLFVGDVEDDKSIKLRDAIRAGKFSQPFELGLEEAGCFPHQKRPKTLTIRVSPHPFLTTLRRQVADVCLANGIDFPNQRFSPHVTVGRVKTASETCSLEKIDVTPARFKVTSFELMKSELTLDGPVYEVLETYQL